VYAFAENFRLCYDETGFFADFPHCCLACRLARLDLTAWELPRQAAFLDPSPHEQNLALVRDDR
jgi:hypothetical protein